MEIADISYRTYSQYTIHVYTVYTSYLCMCILNVNVRYDTSIACSVLFSSKNICQKCNAIYMTLMIAGN